MAKTIFAIEDQEDHLLHLGHAMKGAKAKGGLEEDDQFYLVGAHARAKDVHKLIIEDPEFQGLYVQSTTFENLMSVLEKQVNKLLLLDLDLSGVHGRGADKFVRGPIPTFYAKLTNAPSHNTAVLIYSTALRPKQKVDLVVDAQGRKDRVGWLDTNPFNSVEADQILKEGLNVYFNRPLDHPAIALQLSAFHKRKLKKRAFASYFTGSNSGNQFPAGALEWLTSDWLRDVC